MSLYINEKLVLPNNEIQWRFSRSSGPGGQKLNKTESRVELIFNINNSKTLDSFQKSILFQNLNNKIQNGSISITVQEKRTQYENRQLAISKITSLLTKNLQITTKVRKETKPTKDSQRRRLESKKKRSHVKKNRQYKADQDV